MSRSPRKAGDWPKDREAGRAEFRALMGDELVDGMARLLGLAGGGTVTGAVNVHGDEFKEVTDDMRAQPCALDPDFAPERAPQTYRGKR